MATTTTATGLGRPAFDDVPLVRPSVPDPELFAEDVRQILKSRMLTNAAFVRRFEAAAAEYLGVRHCVAVSSCTSGLMLVLRASDLSGDVIVPSFTFAATVHAVAWNGLRPTFADVTPDTLTLSPKDVERAIGIRTSAILATHLYGTPADVDALAEVARENGLRLFFDAAHAFGSRHGDAHVGGGGDAEVFSLSPTKVLVAGEGGLIATDDDVLAERCRIGRDYANPGDYDCLFVGLNARMSEFHAALALRSLADLDERLERRRYLAARYRQMLGELEGISFPAVPPTDQTTFKDFTILVDREGFGIDAESLGQVLAAVGIDTRRYYAPPVHRMRAYAALPKVDLPITDDVSGRVLTLPMWTDMPEEQLEHVADAIARVQRYARRK